MKLNIDTKHFNYEDQPLKTLNLDKLNKVKRDVKNYLKKYDIMFSTLFHRQPGKTDKEPLRPLYMYYKKLKNIITDK